MSNINNPMYLQKSNYEELIPFVEMKKGIPPIIHQTYKTKNVSDELLDNINELKKLNPGWKYFLYDDEDIENFILQNYGTTILKYYKRINPKYGAAKADFFRYLVIYKKGGVYLDIKSSLTKSLNETLLVNDQLILSHWDNQEGRQHENWGHYKEIKHIDKGEYQQWHIIASPGHPYIRKVILQVLHNIDTYNPYKIGVGLKGTLKTTGPIVYSLVMEEMCKTYSQHRIVDGVDDMGLKYSIYEEALGCYHHKQALKSDYNYQIAPLVDNGFKQTAFYRFYFYQIYRRKIDLERKFEILQRERKLHSNFISFISHILFTR